MDKDVRDRIYTMINRIEDIYEFQGWINDLSNLHLSLDYWAPKMSSLEFIKELISGFVPLNYVFGDRYPDGAIKYFAYVIRHPEDLDKGLFWLFYVSKDQDSSEVVEDMKDFVKDDLTAIVVETSNTGRGYKKWISQFGGYPTTVVYNINLERV